MKKITFSLLIVLLTFVSCSKLIVENSESDAATFDKISLLSNEHYKTIALKSLSPEEKFNYWQSKISKTVSENPLDENQVAVLIDLKNKISVRLFSDDSEREIFYTSILPEWIKKAELSLGQEKVYYTVFTHQTEFPKGKKTTLNSLTDTNIEYSSSESGLDMCHCTIDSRYTCGRLTLPLVLEYGTCSLVEKTTCLNLNDRSCGALFDQICNGNKCTY